jgi:hypothetical protein
VCRVGIESTVLRIEEAVEGWQGDPLEGDEAVRSQGLSRKDPLKDPRTLRLTVLRAGAVTAGMISDALRACGIPAEVAFKSVERSVDKAAAAGDTAAQVGPCILWSLISWSWSSLVRVKVFQAHRSAFVILHRLSLLS